MSNGFTMLRFEYILALVGGGGVLTASVWLYRIDRSLSSAAASDTDCHGDDTVLALVAEPFTSVEETYRTLHELERLFRERKDRRAVFLTVYARVTREVAAAIERDEFENPEWVAEYLVTFADFYRRALYDLESGTVGSLPGAWQLFFRATETNDALISQSAVLGINAHVNYDLALALHTVGIDHDRSTKYRDHRRINGILWRLVDETLDRLAARYAPGIAYLSDVASPLGEVIWFVVLAIGREGAWWIAVMLTKSRREFLHGCIRWTMGSFSTVVAIVILAPNGHSLMLDYLQKLETMPSRR